MVMNRSKLVVAFASLASVVVGVDLPVEADAPAEASGGVRNVIVIDVDDMALGDMVALPKTQRLLGERGVTFNNAFVNTSNCCPSRATLLTGQRSANHGVTSTKYQEPNSYSALDHDNTLATWLEADGFDTIMIGKYLNGYGHLDLVPGVADNKEIPPGWTNFNAFVGEKQYDDFRLNQNGKHVRYRGADNYQTDVLARVGVDAIDRSIDQDRAFFMWMTPFSPHTQSGKPPLPAPRHTDAFDGVQLRESPSFNEASLDDKPAWMRNQPHLNARARRDLRDLHEGRLESLLSVDDLVESIVDKLIAENVLDETIVIFTSDNGYLMGEHRLEGKIRVYEESIRVPLLIAGGPFVGGVTSDAFVSNVDLAPTITAQLGVAPGRAADGVDLSTVVTNPTPFADRALIIEAVDGPGYEAVRTPGWTYVDYVGTATELYDMVNDPFQLESRHADPAYGDVLDEMTALLAQLSGCAGTACRIDAAGQPLDLASGPLDPADPDDPDDPVDPVDPDDPDDPVGGTVDIAQTLTTPSLRVEPGDRSLSASWGHDRGTVFQYQYRSVGGRWTRSSLTTDTSTVIGGLDNGVEHDVWVRFRRSGNWLDWVRAAATPVDAGVPTAASVTIAPSSLRPGVTVAATAPSTLAVTWRHGAAALFQLRYRTVIDGSLGPIEWLPVTDESGVTLNDLTPGTEIQVEVRGLINGVWGPWSTLRLTPH